MKRPAIDENQLILPLRFLSLVQCCHTGDEFHHLTWDESRNRWVLRLTIVINQKVMGKRIVQRLKARTPEEALLLRDGIIESYRALGLEIADRRQARSKGLGLESFLGGAGGGEPDITGHRLS